MSLFTIDGVSPTVQYTPTLASGAANGGLGDPTTGWAIRNDATKYTAPYFYTSSSGMNFQFSFYGTGVALYGGNSGCDFASSVDNSQIPKSSSTSSSSTGGTLLAQVDNLTFGQHTVGTTVNCASTATEFGFMYAQVDGFMGKAGQQAENQTIDDSDSGVHYQGTWTYNVSAGLVGHFQNTQHYTQAASSSFSYSFKAAAISIYGSLYPNHGPYTFSLGGSSKTASGWNPLQVPPTLLFFQGGMDPNQIQVVTGTNVGPGTFEVDRIILQSPSGSGSPSPTASGASFAPSGSSNNNTKNSFHGIPLAAIIGIAAGALFLILLLLLALFRKPLRRALFGPKKDKNKTEYAALTTMSTEPPQTSFSPSPYYPEHYQPFMDSTQTYPPKAFPPPEHYQDFTNSSQQSYYSSTNQYGQFIAPNQTPPNYSTEYQPPGSLGPRGRKEDSGQLAFSSSGVTLAESQDQRNVRDMVMNSENKPYALQQYNGL